MEGKSFPARHTGPGLVDLQVNGYLGFDFNDKADAFSAEMLHRIREAMMRRGIAAALPTFITAPCEDMLARARKYSQLADADPELAKFFPKLHLEGPFITPEQGPRGAHPLGACVTPEANPDFMDAIIDASGGRIGILTLAPELPGSLALIEALAARGICVAIGHTNADAETLSNAAAAGARMSTHLGNASHPILPRLDNYIQRQLADDRLHASFIADGHHIPFTTLKNFLRAKTPERSALVTDAISAADMPPGHYPLLGEEVEVFADFRTSKPGHAAGLAGSAITLDRTVINVASHCDVTFEMAWEMASIHPAALVDIPLPEPVTVEISDDGFRIIAA